MYSDFVRVRSEKEPSVVRFEPKKESVFQKDIRNGLSSISTKLEELDGSVAKRLQDVLAAVTSSEVDVAAKNSESTPQQPYQGVQAGGSLEDIIAIRVEIS